MFEWISAYSGARNLQWNFGWQEELERELQQVLSLAWGLQVELEQSSSLPRGALVQEEHWRKEHLVEGERSQQYSLLGLVRFLTVHR